MIFLAIINQGYRHTFYSFQTAHAWVKSYFDEENDESQRSQLHMHNTRMWKSIRPQYAEWLAANWSRWEEEQPEWFNDVFRAQLEVENLIPADAEHIKARTHRRTRATQGDRGAGRAKVIPLSISGARREFDEPSEQDLDAAAAEAAAAVATESSSGRSL